MAKGIVYALVRFSQPYDIMIISAIFVFGGRVSFGARNLQF